MGDAKRNPETGQFMSEEQFAAYSAEQRKITALFALAIVGLVLAAIALGLSISGHRQSHQPAPPVLFGAGESAQHWNPGYDPYAPPTPPRPRSGEYIVTGEAARQSDGQLRLTVGFYPKGGQNAPYWLPGETDAESTLKLEPTPDPVPAKLCPCGCGKLAAECTCKNGECQHKKPEPQPAKGK